MENSSKSFAISFSVQYEHAINEYESMYCEIEMGTLLPNILNYTKPQVVSKLKV